MINVKNNIEVLPKKAIHLAKDAVMQIEKQIQVGENLLRNRPIQQKTFDSWESSTADILKKSAEVDPVGSVRFACCADLPNGYVENEAFLENNRAMTIYDQISILEYYQNRLKREIAASKVPVPEQ